MSGFKISIVALRIALIVIAHQAFGYSLTIQQQNKATQASQRIISLIKANPFYRTDKVLPALDMIEKTVAGDHEKRALIQRIEYVVGGFLSCVKKNGEWLGEHQECEYITQKTCDDIGGIYTDCASACRHTISDVCTFQCVPVCSL